MRRDSERDFEAFLRERGSALLRTAYLLTGDRGQAQDLLQEVLEKAYLRWDTIRCADEPVAYLRRCLTNASTSRWRRLRARAREVSLHAGIDRATVDPTEAVDQRDEQARALARLSPQQRAVLVLRYWEDLSEAECAQVLGCSVGTVKSQASRGLARLRALMDPRRPADDVTAPVLSPMTTTRRTRAG